MSPGPDDYVELRCQSAFSFLDAASTPEDLVARAADLGHSSLALADRDGLYGAPRAHQAARAAGLHARVGAELTLAPGSGLPRLLLLCESQAGYRNLSRLLTRAHTHGEKGTAHADWETLGEHAAGLTALARGDAHLTAEGLGHAQKHFPGRLWVDVSRTLERTGEASARRAAAVAAKHRVPVVASGGVSHARAEDRRLLDALTCLRHKTRLDRAGRLLAPNGERHLRTREETLARFADQPEWICATRAVAERCDFTLEDLGYRFPEYPVPRGQTQATWLRRLTAEGATRRYGNPLPGRVRAQLDHELAIIEKLGLAGYFLIVDDIARFARQHGILCQGRGSAANSAVCYALGITAVDAVGMELLFERFLSEERGEWPDIDLDLPSGAPRERVIQYVFGKYGARGAAMTAVVISYRTRMAVREMGKVLGIEPGTLDRLSRVVSTLQHREDLDELGDLLRQGGVDPNAPRVTQLLDLVNRVRGLPRHLGQHTGGVVIAAGRLDEVVPIEPAAMADRRVVQWDKDDCADLGIIKIDLLGLGMLNALERTIPLIEQHEGKTIDLAHLPPDDPDTYAMVQRADTVGTFQIESRAQMATLPRILALIPARGGSKGVPRKNVRLVSGKPLIAYTIETALAAKHLFHRIIVSTDDAEISAVSKKYGAEVPFIRPEELSGDLVPTLPVAQHAIQFVEQQDDIVLDWLFILQPTDPFRTVEDLEKGLELAISSSCDSVVSVVRVYETHPVFMKRINDNRLVNFGVEAPEGTRRQDCEPPAYMSNGAVYLTRRDVIMEQNSIWGTVTRPYIMPAERSINVDSELDLKLIEVLMQEKIHSSQRNED